MLKILGERKMYGRKSPMDKTFVSFGVPYRGTRSQANCRGPWYLYESGPGSKLIDLDAAEKVLVEQGYVNENVDFAVTNRRTHTAYARWFQRDDKLGSDRIILVNYDFLKPARNYSHIGHIFYNI